jgi:tetratricopeptide (TPR) repeat protein
MGYWGYYLAWILVAYGLSNPWFLVGIAVFLVLRRFIPAPGVLFRTLGRIGALRGQVEANPANVTARRDLARMYLELRRPGRAAELLRVALERNGDSAELHYLLGLAEHRRRRHEDAIAPLVTAVELDPRVAFGEPYLVAGDVLSALRRWEEAEDAYLRYLDLNSSSLKARLALAHALSARGARGEARRWVDEALQTFHQLPGYERRRQLGSWFRAHWARLLLPAAAGRG